MASPDALRDFLLKKGYRIIDWGIIDKDEHTNAPEASGVYALYWGRTLQYIGMAGTSFYQRMLNHSNEDAYPFGSFAWFQLPAGQEDEAETTLIRKYKPPYNKYKLGD